MPQLLIFVSIEISYLARFKKLARLAYRDVINNLLKGDIMTCEQRQELVSEHISLAKALAFKFYNRRRSMGLELDDFASAAMLGLCEAAKSFKPESNCKFAPFAFFRIRGAMYDLVRSSGTIPRCMFAVEENRVSIKYQMARDLSELESLRTIIEEYGLKLIFSNNEMPELTYSRELDPEQKTAQREARSYIRNLINELSDEKQQVLDLYYFEEKTYREIEPELDGYSKSWICRLHKGALSSLRDAIETRHMRWDLEAALGRA